MHVFLVIFSFTYFRFSISTTVAWELSSLAHKLSNILDHLKTQLATCYQHIGLHLSNFCICYHVLDT